MLVSSMKIIFLLLMIVIINLIQARFSEVPPPPQRPERFHSREELKHYLQKVHEYHSIVGRWRLRRGMHESSFLDASNGDLFNFFDMNNDRIITSSEFDQRLKLRNSKE